VVSIEEGIFLNSKIKIHSKKLFKLSVDGELFEFRIPKGIEIPTENGEVRLSSAQVKQPYDVFTSINSEINLGETQSLKESCNWVEPVTICDSDSSGRRVCRVEYKTRYGRKEILFHNKEISKLLKVTLYEPVSSALSASFIGSQRYFQRVVEYEGRCF
jgi:hypothetical protein